MTKTEFRGSWQLWTRDDAAVEAALLNGAAAEAELTAFGLNDAILGYLMDSGLWAVMTGMTADGLKCHNGYRPEALNGVEVIRELAHIARIQQCGRILADTRLMMQAGFNVARIEQTSQVGKPLIDPDTLANHLARISPASAQRTFVEYVRQLRKRRLIRGKVYAADAHEIIIPYGRGHERIGRVGKKYGFKLVILINVQEERERIVGFELAPLQTSERAMLSGILKRLNQEVAPLGEWLQLLLLDRGYWGAKYLLGLKRDYQVDIVTRAQHDGLEAVDYIETALGEATWQEEVEEHSRLGKIRVKAAGIRDVPLYDGRGEYIGRINAVVTDEYDQAGQRLKDEDGRERPRFYYVSTAELGRRVYSTRAAYRKRWVVENQGFRELTQAWAIDTLTGHNFNANYARIAFVLMLYSIERIMRMKDAEGWTREQEQIKRRLGKGLLGGLSVVVYTTDGRLGLFSVGRYGEIVRRAERARIIATLRRKLKPGQTAQELLDKIDL